MISLRSGQILILERWIASYLLQFFFWFRNKQKWQQWETTPHWPSSAWPSANYWRDRARSSGSPSPSATPSSSPWNPEEEQRLCLSPGKGGQALLSTVKRIAMRRSEFLAKKRMEVAASEEAQADVESTQQLPQKAPFPCDQCGLGFRNGNVMENHTRWSLNLQRRFVNNPRLMTSLSWLHPPSGTSAESIPAITVTRTCLQPINAQMAKIW